MSDFDAAFPKLLKLEGGYVNRSDDSGGPTKYGISQSAYPTLDIENLSVNCARAIYLRDYWGPYRIGEIACQDIAEHVFSLLVNMGPFHNFQIVQRAINNCGVPVIIDGKVGPQTIRAINQIMAVQLLRDEIIIEAIKFYVRLGKPKFLGGWINRVLS